MFLFPLRAACTIWSWVRDFGSIHRSQNFTVALNERLRGSLGVFHGEEDYEIVVELDAWAADDVRGRRLHSSQELTEMPGGMLRVRLRLDSLEEVEKWVLKILDGESGQIGR